MKVKNILGVVALSMAAISFTGCSADELDTYVSSGKDGLFIQDLRTFDIYGNPLSYRDRYEHSFAGSTNPDDQRRFSLYVRLQGNVSKVDRKYTMIVDPDSTTCSEANYDISANDFTIKAGQAIDTVVVTLKRTVDLRAGAKRLYLRLLPNENFDIAFDGLKDTPVWSTPGNMLKADGFSYIISETYVEPFYYSSFGRTYFGPFTAAKIIAMGEAIGWTYAAWGSGGQSGRPVQYGRMSFMAAAFRDWLQEKADAGTPVREDDGSLMQLPSPNQVNYSAYE